MRAVPKFVVAVCAVVSLIAPVVSVGVARADDPPFVAWSAYLPSLVSAYDPGSSDDCVAGRDQCAVKIVKDMNRRLDVLSTGCSHNAVFSLAYLRITQGYAWIRDIPDTDGSPQYQNRQWMNYVVATFASAYLWAYDQAAAGVTVPKPWQITFDAANNNEVSGTGDLLLGINAHINRDLAFVMASTGLVTPDGRSGKRDYDQVNELLNLLTPPLNAEEQARFDSTIDGGTAPAPIYTSIFQLIAEWREQAWRNAEALVSARTAEERTMVAQKIENDATARARSLHRSYAYTPPLTSTANRDAHCAKNHAALPPVPYPFSIA